MARNLVRTLDRVKSAPYSPSRVPPDKIARMNGTVLILLAVTLAAVLIVLLTGLIGMARGGVFNAKHGNTLMRARVVLQGLAIVLFLLLFMTAERG